MSINMGEFYQEFFQEVHGIADAEGQLVEDAFFDQMCSHLIDTGELETADRAYFSARGFQIDGYGGDPIETDNVLNLIISDFSPSTEITTLTQTEMDAIFKRSLNFLNKSLDPSFRDSLEETSPAFGIADLIGSRWNSIEKIRFFLISNRVLSSRIDGREAGEYDGKPVTYSVWDLGRLHRYVFSGMAREEVNIDLEKEFGQSLYALPAHLSNAGYHSYLVVVPGSLLASVYDRWGARLLEQNVRVFLQARGNVNKGIRNTIDNNPEMFFAYNNGITATAVDIKTQVTSDGLQIKQIKNLQIVNGGQTTASIHLAKRKNVDLSKVFVQMKLSIVDPQIADDVVPKISEYANSQNRVNAADFFANHPYHVRMEEFSRRIYAPSPAGTFKESKWFYERARGQYNDARNKFNPKSSEQKKFDSDYPKRQLFTKTDLAKFINVWEGKPDTVSKGAQRNFADFAANIGKEWDKNPNYFNEMYYQHIVAKAIVFRKVEKLISEQEWYQGGYRANIVAYAIAKLGLETDGLVNFNNIWRKQDITQNMSEALATISKAVHDVIIAPPTNMRNVTEWAKKQACWKRVQELRIDLPIRFKKELVTKDEKKADQKSAVKEQKMLNGIEAQAAVVNAGSNFWKEVKEWGEVKKVLTNKEISVLSVAERLPNSLPTEKQSVLLLKTLHSLNEEGCPIELNV